MNTKKGFTLIELLVVVLIIGILAAMAMPQYFKAVERSRMTEADQLLSSIAQAQQRKYLQINKYSTDFGVLDVAPKGAAGTTFYTKGDPVKGGGNGFAVTLSGTDYDLGSATATRVAANNDGTLQYKYSLSRKYASDKTTCTAGNDNGASLCSDFCGIADPITNGNSCCNDGSKKACDTKDGD